MEKFLNRALIVCSLGLGLFYWTHLPLPVAQAAEPPPPVPVADYAIPILPCSDRGGTHEVVVLKKEMDSARVRCNDNSVLVIRTV